MFKRSIMISMLAMPFALFANDNNEGLQDMSDPLAVYTQGGIGYTDKGLNFKVGKTFDTGSETTMGMNVIELKGIFGNAIGFRDSDNPMYSGVDDSIDSFRFRNFKVDMTNGRGGQIDFIYNVDRETADASYSFIQGLPQMGRFNFYPLAGLGATVQNTPDEGYQLPGTFGIVGMYSKFTVTDKIWLNYNPMWMTTISGSDSYKHTYFGGSRQLFTHELAASYQINPRMNVRYFANWNEKVDFGKGDHRIEFNYQF